MGLEISDRTTLHLAPRLSLHQKASRQQGHCSWLPTDILDLLRQIQVSH